MDILGLSRIPDVAASNDPTAMGDRARQGDAGAVDSVAQGFESMFMSLLLKQMRQTLEPGTMFGKDDSDILGGLFDFTMSQHLAKSGALGIGAMLRQQLAQRYQT